MKLRFKKEMQTPRGKELLDLDLSIPSGEFITVFGESGAGKTTFLRILAGLTQPQEGFIEVDGEIWFDSLNRINRPVQQRKIGVVFQENNLFPHMTVRENLEYSCGDKSALGTIDEWIIAMGLKGLESQKPDKISGGQKQRVALIRALIRQPKVLLLDEPLSDLDMHSRLNLQDEIIKVYQKTRTTTILVSHDLSEVFKLSKKVFVIDHGKITKSGSPQEVFVNNDVSGKFKFTGEIIEIHKDGVINILTLSIGNNVTKVAASDEEIAGLTIGSKVIIAAKAFNPLILSRL
ncbi:MAG: ATP-binding cassette domain-containing protein [Candidatus Omnitrophica bacterium]|nr:ATP-binding cassette domain-containing protein [Candidatus Omnitrophota bacterium]